MDPELFNNTEICLKVRDNVVCSYDPLNGQLGFKLSAGNAAQFRCGNDYMSQYFIINCLSLPQKEGQTVNASMEWTLGETVQSRSNLEFKVKKMDDSGLVWLWCKKESIGAVVQIL